MATARFMKGKELIVRKKSMKDRLVRRRIVVPLLLIGVGSVGFLSVNGANAATSPATPAVAGREIAAKAACAQQSGCSMTELQKQIDNFGAARAVPAGAKWPEKSQIVAAAQGVASEKSGDKSKLPARSTQMTYGEFLSKYGQGADPLIDPSRPVVLVTVHGNRDDLGEKVKDAGVYTEVFDAATGSLITEGINVDAFAG
jgi:hypothetical protein